VPRLPLSEIIKRDAEKARIEFSSPASDYGIVRKNYDAIAAARAAGVSWRSIVEAAEFEDLVSRQPELTVRVYFNTMRRQAERSKAMRTAGAPPGRTLPAAQPGAVAGSKPLPPMPGVTAGKTGNPIFDAIPQISANPKDK